MCYQNCVELNIVTELIFEYYSVYDTLFYYNGTERGREWQILVQWYYYYWLFDSNDCYICCKDLELST